jgi:Tfp pilus assembly protein PilN
MPVAAMYAVLFLTSLFFMYRYYSQKHEMDIYKQALSQYPKELITADASELQARIDSLQYRTVGLVGSLDVLDSLLVGSDKWSRALSATASITAEVPGIWIESWEEDDGQLELTGTSTDRNAVVSFATQAEATIESLEWSDIRGQTVYNFTMHMKTSDELPNVARYFRDNIATTVPVQITTSD